MQAEVQPLARPPVPPWSKTLKNFAFNLESIRVPSARQLVYGDGRANPAGRLPDDVDPAAAGFAGGVSAG